MFRTGVGVVGRQAKVRRYLAQPTPQAPSPSGLIGGITRDACPHPPAVPALEFGATKPPESPRLILNRWWCLSAGAEMIEPKPAVRRRWTVTEDNLLHDMLNAGLTAEQIGQRLARTPVAVYSRVQDLDRKRRKRPAS
jgi:hypothetical protein